MKCFTTDLIEVQKRLDDSMNVLAGVSKVDLLRELLISCGRDNCASLGDETVTKPRKS